MSYFDQAFQDVIVGVEKGYSDNPNDPGGETKFGISKRSYPHIDIKNLSEQDAKDIYSKEWWDPKYDQITDYALASRLFSYSINMGMHQATILLQRALVEFSNVMLVDGVLGPITIAAINKSNQLWLLDKFKLQAAHFYADIARLHDNQKQNLPGLILKRCEP